MVTDLATRLLPVTTKPVSKQVYAMKYTYATILSLFNLKSTVPCDLQSFVG